MTTYLENTYKTIMTKYDTELNGYKYVLPTTRYLLKSGYIIKYIKINDSINKQKILFGFIISTTLDEITIKSLNSSFVWKIKINSNYIFVKNPHANKLRELLEDKFWDLIT